MPWRKWWKLAKLLPRPSPSPCRWNSCSRLPTRCLVWVHSDADKVAAVQAEIAATPKPVHVPRERPPLVALDEGPLILVETRRDLAAQPLPFEQAAQ